MQNDFSNKKPLNPVESIIAGILLIVIGAIILVLSNSLLSSYNEKNKTYIETTAKIVDYDYTYGTDNEELMAIIVKYDVGENTYTKKSDSYSNIVKPKGTYVKIKYNPENPSEIIWVNDSSNIIVPLVGIVFIVVGIIIIITSILKLLKPNSSLKTNKESFDNTNEINETILENNNSIPTNNFIKNTPPENTSNINFNNNKEQTNNSTQSDITNLYK